MEDCSAVILTTIFHLIATGRGLTPESYNWL